ncbi:phosphatidylinositol-glycan-specific phospholipase D [Brachionus plicatilis]|uniref:Phosphatidylinositol-glycan-specific phospholipase D n=1 Tax=Brachionus plicatilis TaxID=10195 RepID=A0A3M7S3D0_BRAPC|nr:phosphatidylinositol-glycan-specific phospholipase D [Brachionus plicatilis]
MNIKFLNQGSKFSWFSIKFSVGSSVFYLFLIDSSQSCGISTHIEIAHRAASHYDHIFDQNLSAKKLIEKYQSAFQAGNPYPDSYYPSICKKGVLADVSEDTHWVPFLNATIRYIQKTYQRPFNEDAQRLIVFTLGYISHQMADVTWHSLGVVQGFLSSMGFVNFHGSFSEAHSVGDFGGDVVNQFELNTKYISDLGEWYVPYNDLYNIYKDLYGTEKITKSEIIECSSLLFLGRLGEQIAVSLLYADYFKKSSFMVDRLNDFFLGGIDDMATWTQISWNKFFFMLENGIDKCKLDHNIMFINCNQTREEKSNAKKLEYKSVEPHYELNNLDSSHYQAEITQQGVYLRSTLKYKQHFKFRLGKWLYQEADSTYYVRNDNAQLGWSMATGDLDQDGNDDLVIGAPVFSELNSYQNGAVFAVTSANKSIPFEELNLEEKASFVIKPPSDAVSSRFGHSVTILDINSDGFNDIVGRVYIYFGDKSLSYKAPNVTIYCHKFKYCNLGWKISSGDVNLDGKADLIISSPFAATCDDQCGFVSVLLNRNKLNSQIEITDSDWFLTGKMAYEWFGFSAKAKYGYLSVGAPQSRKCYRSDCQISDQDIQSAGRVYVYKYPSQKPVMVLNGEKEWAQFGYDFDMSFQEKNLVMAVSSITEDTKLQNGTSFELNRAGRE